MENYSDIIQTISLAMGASWASGINLYATIFVLGFSALNGAFVLPAGLEVLSNPLVLSAAGFMYCVEFFADKIPGVDTSWDAIHTFIRIPAGAMLAAGALGDMGLAAEVSAAIVGGGLATATHATKAGSRVMINTSPEPFTNWGASLSEDFVVFAGLWTALNHPIFFLVALVLFLILLIWLLPKLWRGIKKVFKFLAGLFGGNKEEKHLHVEEVKRD